MKLKAVLVAVALGISGLMLLPGPSGFCYETKSFLSETELIKRLFDQYNDRRPRLVSVGIGNTYVEATILPYRNTEETIQANPECCKVKKIIWRVNTRSASFFDWLFLGHSYYISGRIKNSFQLPNGTIIEKTTPIGDGSRVVSSCGQLRD